MNQSEIDAIRERITQEAKYMQMVNGKESNTVYYVYCSIGLISFIFGFIMGRTL